MGAFWPSLGFRKPYDDLSEEKTEEEGASGEGCPGTLEGEQGACVLMQSQRKCRVWEAGRGLVLFVL